MESFKFVGANFRGLSFVLSLRGQKKNSFLYMNNEQSSEVVKDVN